MQNFYQPYPYQQYNPPVQDNLAMLRQAYQPTYQQPVNAPQDERIWVQGEDAARAYLMAPNSFVRLWDSNDTCFYEKSTDPTGKPRMDKFMYEKCVDSSQNTEQSRKVKEEYEEKLKALEARISALERMRENDAESDLSD